MDTHCEEPLAVLVDVDTNSDFFGLLRKALERGLELTRDLVGARVEDSSYFTTVEFLIHDA